MAGGQKKYSMLSTRTLPVCDEQTQCSYNLNHGSIHLSNPVLSKFLPGIVLFLSP